MSALISLSSIFISTICFTSSSAMFFSILFFFISTVVFASCYNADVILLIISINNATDSIAPIILFISKLDMIFVLPLLIIYIIIFVI